MSSLHSHLLQLGVESHPGIQGFVDPGSLLDLLQPLAQGACPLQPGLGFGPSTNGIETPIDSLIIIPTSNAESSITEDISRMNAEAVAERLLRCMETSLWGIGKSGFVLGGLCSFRSGRR